MPQASISSTSHTVTRSPRIQGCPERWPGTTLIRERSALSTVAIAHIILHSGLWRERQVRLPDALEIHKVARHLHPRDGARQVLRRAAQFLMVVHPLRRQVRLPDALEIHKVARH